MIKSLPIEEQPREKAVLNGIESLSNTELLALLLGSGTREDNVLTLSERLLNEIGGISHLKDVSYATLTAIKGVKKAKAVKILAAIELSSRIRTAPMPQLIMDEPYKIYNYVKDRMQVLEQEHFVILILDNHCRIIKEKTVFIGGVNATLVSAREIFREALRVNGVMLIVIHNHPSGDAHPSKEDENFTKQLFECGEMMNIPVIDHLIIGWNQYYSFRNRRMIHT